MYEPVPGDGLVPKMYMLYDGQAPRRIALRLTTLKKKRIIRITGGCGSLAERRAKAMYHLFGGAFQGCGELVLMFGGTRMHKTSDLKKIRHGITEVAPIIHQYNPETMLVGVVPIEKPPLELDIELGHVISREEEYVTIVHPAQDFYFLLQASPDDGVIWEAEYKFCLKFIIEMNDCADFSSLLVSYNGGKTTRKEIIETANLGLPVLLVDGSGGETQKLARNKGFLADFEENVFVCAPTVDAMREALGRLGMLDIPESAQVISITRSKELA